MNWFKKKQKSYPNLDFAEFVEFKIILTDGYGKNVTANHFESGDLWVTFNTKTGWIAYQTQFIKSIEMIRNKEEIK